MHQQDLKSVFESLSEKGASPGVLDLLAKFHELFKPTEQEGSATFFETTGGVLQRMQEIYPGEDLSLDLVYFFLNAAGYSLKNLSESSVDMRWLLKAA